VPKKDAQTKIKIDKQENEREGLTVSRLSFFKDERKRKLCMEKLILKKGHVRLDIEFIFNNSKDEITRNQQRRSGKASET
jgi:hypothetical protein